MKLQVLILSVASALFFQGVAAAPSEAAPAACKTSTCNKNCKLEWGSGAGGYCDGGKCICVYDV